MTLPQSFSQVLYALNSPLTILYILIGILPLIFVGNLYDKAELPRYALLSFSTILASLLFISSYKNNKTLYWSKSQIFFLIFIIYALLSTNWSVDYGLYTENSIKLVSLSLIFLLASQINNIKQIQTLFYICTFAASVVSIIGVLQKFNLNPFNFLQTSPPASSFINKNFASNYLDLIIPINFILLILSSCKKTSWLLALALSLNISYVLIIVSRGSWLALVVFFILFLIAANKLSFLKEKLITFSAVNKAPLLVLFIIPILLFNLPGVNGRVLKDQAENFSPYKATSSSARANSYLTSFDIIKDKPVFGVGFGNFHIAFQSYKRDLNSDHKVETNLLRLHNDLLQLFVELGLIGVGLFLLLIFVTLKPAIYAFKQKSTASQQLNNNKILKQFLSLALILSLFSSFTHSLVSFPMHQSNTSLIIFLWMGCLTALYSRKLTSPALSQFSIYFFLIIILLFSFFAIPHYQRALNSSYHINEAIKYFENKDCNNAIKQSELAIEKYSKDYYSQSWVITVFSDCHIKNTAQIENITNVILESNPLHPYALKMSALNYYQQQKYSLAEKPFLMLTHLYPSLPTTYIELGHTFYKQNKFIKAKREYLKALRLEKNNATAIKALKKTNFKIKTLNINKH